MGFHCFLGFSRFSLFSIGLSTIRYFLVPGSRSLDGALGIVGGALRVEETGYLIRPPCRKEWSVRPPVRPSGRPSGRLSRPPSAGPSARPSARAPGRPPGRPAGRPFVRASARPSVRPSVRPPARPSVRAPQTPSFFGCVLRTSKWCEG